MAEKKKAPISTHSQASDKKKALETCIAQIEKNYGKGAIMRLGDDIPVNVEALSTGSLSLDLALGIGGVPKGRIIEIYGPEASGKQRLRCTSSRRLRRPAARRHTSTLSTRSSLHMPVRWASISTVCSSHSPIPASRRSTSPKVSSARARLMLLLLTQSRLLSRALSLRARWATPLSARLQDSCRRQCAVWQAASRKTAAPSYS